MLKAMVSPSLNPFIASVKLPGPVGALLVTVRVAAWAALNPATAKVMREIRVSLFMNVGCIFIAIHVFPVELRAI